VAVLLRARLGVGTGSDGWQVLAQLSASPEVCPAFIVPHKRTTGGYGVSLHWRYGLRRPGSRRAAVDGGLGYLGGAEVRG
jgi:hypothetical protein